MQPNKAACLVLALSLAFPPAARAAASLDDELTQQSAQEQQFFDGRGRIPGASPAVEAVPGSADHGAAAPLSKGTATAAPARDQDAVPRPSPAAKKQRSVERVEDRLFKISWWLYHASWAADTFMTGWGISHGMGYEADHLYTLFGNRNVAGVVGSLAVGHALASGLTLMLHRKAKRHHGLAHHLLEGAAIGINIAGIVAHAAGAASWGRIL